MTAAVDTPRTVEVEGRAYEVRRLNVRDTFTVGKVIAGALTRAGQNARPDMSAQAVGMMMFASVPYAEEELIGLCASLIGVTAEEFAAMPPETLPDVIEAVVEGQDMAAFLSACARLARSEKVAGMLR